MEGEFLIEGKSLLSLIIIVYNFNLTKMKNFIINTTLIIIAVIIYGCDKPAPTELINDVSDGEQLEYEILTNDLNEHYISRGTDTSGIMQDFKGLRNLISVSGIKITNQNHTVEFCLAQGFFFDWTQPVYYSNERLLGYKTIIPGIMKFDNNLARIDTYEVRFRDRGEFQDTILGNKFILYRSKSGNGDPFWFEYGSPVSFEFQPFSGEPVTFDIPTLKDITGTVQLRGNSSDKNLEAVLEWNETEGKRVWLVLGVIRPGQMSSLPVYRFGVKDRNKLIIPKRFFNELQLQNFNKLVFTFIRSIEKMERHGEINLFVSSQNIHSIVIDIP